MSADHTIDPNARLRGNVTAVERYAHSLVQHIARSGDGPDSYAFAVVDEIRQAE